MSGDELLLALRTIVSLAAVIGLLLFLGRRLQKGQAAGGSPFAALVPRRLGRLRELTGARAAAAPRAKAEKITLVARTTLGAKAQLVVAEFGGIRYVLGVSEKGIDVVDTQEAPTAAVDASEGDAPGDDASENVISLADAGGTRGEDAGTSTAA
ncbi:flagellar biosynthetic protein FliO [Microbacterium sp. NPDC007973]|uniref:flagellar biosynthetic protein FliO n=1 Tax=Microbacterium sp. NPDC007973 TaxID=3364182 RepID=UPI0036E01954